jgi:hypothetical protein
VRINTVEAFVSDLLDAPTIPKPWDNYAGAGAGGAIVGSGG